MRILIFVSKKERNSRQSFISSASVTWMSTSKAPERLAEILQEILALSNSTATSQSESISGGDPGKLSDAPGVEDHSQRRAEDDKNWQIP